MILKKKKTKKRKEEVVKEWFLFCHVTILINFGSLKSTKWNYNQDARKITQPLYITI